MLENLYFPVMIDSTGIWR